MSYDVVIGIEVHCELNTKTKMFSSAPLSFGEKANTCTNEIDLGHPGTLPEVNKEAIRYAIMACSALHCEIDTLVRFDRKNYYYSDLPKGFQITQQFYPIGSRGYIDIVVDGQTKQVRINRLHMEEDTAKQFHHGNKTLIDFNRAGTPLVEIVSEPDMSSAAEAVAYISELRRILLYLGVSDVRMEEGSFRCDVNISLKEKDSDTLGVKTEIKNLNSLANIEKAIVSEIARHTELLENGEAVEQATRRFDETRQTTVMMRKKEGAIDYKYFPEPNILPIQLDHEWVLSIVNSLPELADARLARYLEQYGLSEYDASIIVTNKPLSDYYDTIVQHTTHYKLVANWLISEVLANQDVFAEKGYSDTIKPEYFGLLVNMIEKGDISSKQAKTVYAGMLEGKSPEYIVNDLGLKQQSDPEQIKQWIKRVLDDNPQVIEDYKNGKDRAVKFIIGQIMKESKGQANPALTSQLVLEALKLR